MEGEGGCSIGAGEGSGKGERVDGIEGDRGGGDGRGSGGSDGGSSDEDGGGGGGGLGGGGRIGGGGGGHGGGGGPSGCNSCGGVEVAAGAIDGGASFEVRSPLIALDCA